jgi:thioredoxin reductase
MRGYIKVNDRLETTASGVWAVGDRASSPQFAQVFFDCECGCIRINRELRPDLHVHRAHHLDRIRLWMNSWGA